MNDRLNSKTFLIDGPSGAIEVLCEVPEDVNPYRGWGVVLHPHPLMGGSMNHKVPYILSRVLLDMGYVSIRFNFRGVGRSGGSYAEGHGEMEDAVHVVSWARREYSHLSRCALFGFSFGAFVGSHVVAQPFQSFDHIVLVGIPPLRFDCVPVPKHTLLIHGELDELSPLDVVMDWAAPQNVPVIVFPQTSHFFDHKLIVLREYILSSLS